MVGVYTQKQWCAAVLLAAFWGWAMFGLFDPIGYMMSDRFVQGMNRLLLLTIVGLPIAIVVSFLAVGPALRKMMRKPVGFRTAATWGAGISAALAGLSIVWGRLRGWRMSIDDTRYAQTGGGDFIRSIDGILTPYGWQVLAQNTVAFIAWCTIGALLIRLAIGPGHADKP
ncbi:MAG: hypothetical protein AAF965_14465 [Pseudomonadota bacterium]